MEDRTELGTLGWRHVAEIQKMPPGLDDDRSCTGLLQRGVLDEEVLAFDDVAPWTPGRPGALTPFSGRLASGRCCSPTGDNTEAGRLPLDHHWIASPHRRRWARGHLGHRRGEMARDHEPLPPGAAAPDPWTADDAGTTWGVGTARLLCFSGPGFSAELRDERLGQTKCDC